MIIMSPYGLYLSFLLHPGVYMQHDCMAVQVISISYMLVIISHPQLLLRRELCVAEWRKQPPQYYQTITSSSKSIPCMSHGLASVPCKPEVKHMRVSWAFGVRDLSAKTQIHSKRNAVDGLLVQAFPGGREKQSRGQSPVTGANRAQTASRGSCKEPCRPS